MSVISEGLECFGGQGYIESTGLPGLLRDAQVLPIWEGTTNILSLDVLRSLKISKSDNESLQVFLNRCRQKLKNCLKAEYREQIGVFLNSLQIVESFLSNKNMNAATLELHSRALAYSMSRIYMGILLLEQASLSDSDLSDHLSFVYWAKKDLVCGLDQIHADDNPDEWRKFFL